MTSTGGAPPGRGKRNTGKCGKSTWLILQLHNDDDDDVRVYVCVCVLAQCMHACVNIEMHKCIQLSAVTYMVTVN